jgi:hypothetical protein
MDVANTNRILRAAVTLPLQVVIRMVYRQILVKLWS